MIRVSITPLSGDAVEHDVDPTTRVQELQRQVQELMPSPHYIKLTLAGQILSPTASLAESGVEDGALIAVVCIPMPRYVVTKSGDYTAKLWRAATGECIHTFPHDKCVSSAVFSRDGASLLTSSEDGTAKIWCIHDGACIQTFRHYLFGDIHSIVLWRWRLCLDQLGRQHRQSMERCDRTLHSKLPPWP